MGNALRSLANPHWYLYRPIPGFIAGYPGLSQLQHAHTRMLGLEMRNETELFLEHTGTRVRRGTLIDSANAPGDLDCKGDRIMGFAGKAGRWSGVHGLLTYDIRGTGVSLAVMFRVPILRPNNLTCCIPVGKLTNAFAVGVIHGPIDAGKDLHNLLDEGTRETWFTRCEDNGSGEDIKYELQGHHFDISGVMSCGKKAMLRITVRLRLPLYKSVSWNVRLAVFKAEPISGLAVDWSGMSYALLVDARELTFLIQPVTVGGEMRMERISVEGPSLESVMLPKARALCHLELGELEISMEDLFWEANHVSLNNHAYNARAANSFLWVRELAEKIGIDKRTRKKLLVKRVIRKRVRMAKKDKADVIEMRPKFD